MIETLRRILDVFATVPPVQSESPEESERRKTFETFLLAEYNNIANAHFNTVDSIANFMKNYIVIASVPFFVIGVLLSAKQSPDNALLAAVTQNPLVPGVLMLGLSMVGLCVLGYIVNIRYDAILYARAVNGIRNYFYKRATLEPSTESAVRVLPTNVELPQYFEPTYFGFVVAIFAIVGSAYFCVGAFYLERFLGRDDSWPIWAFTLAFFAGHFLLYRLLATQKEAQQSHAIQV